MKGILRHIALLSLLALTSCFVKNDLSYPRILAEIIEFEVEGQTNVIIDPSSLTVTVEIGETAELSSLPVKTFRISEKATCSKVIPDVLDLTEPLNLTLSIYQDYEWTIRAVQHIDRYVECSNQAGPADFDVENRIATVYVLERQDLDTVTFTDMKLERIPSKVISTTGYETVGYAAQQVTHKVEFPMTLNCTISRSFSVEYRDEIYDWTIKVVQKKIDLEVQDVNAWTDKAYVKAIYDGRGEPVLQFRKSGEFEWHELESEFAGINITSKLENLRPASTYELRLVNGTRTSAIYTFMTEEEAQIPNSNFDSWYQSGKTWYPDIEGAPLVWDTANPGTSSLGSSPTTPESSNLAVAGEGKHAVRMESSYTVIKFAAGNIYTGSFGKVSGMGAELDWGYPFSSRPKALRGYIHYVPVAIDYADKAHESLKGTMDECQIQIALADWEGQFRINTNTGTFMSPDDPGIIAYGHLESGATDGYIPFEIPLEYKSLERKPNFIVVSCGSSRYGDFFTGGKGSVLYIDEFELVY